MGLFDIIRRKRLPEATAREVYADTTVRDQERNARHYRPRDIPSIEAMERAIGVVYQCADTNASVCSSQPLRMYRRVKSTNNPVRKSLRAYMESGHAGKAVAEFASGQDDMELVEQHPALTLLRDPSPDMNGLQWSWLRFFMKEMTGKAYSLVGWSERTGRPISLNPLLSQYTEILLDTADGGAGGIVGFLYGRNEREAVTLEPEDVLYFRHSVSPYNPYAGIGPLQAVLAEADLLVSVLMHDKTMADRGYMPAAIATIPSDATEDQVRMVGREFNARGGPQSGARIHVARAGELSLEPLSWNPKDLQTGEQIERYERRIRQAFGHTESMADSNASTYASAVVGYSEQYMGSAIRPRLARDASELTQYMADLFGFDPDEYCLVYDDPVVSDVESLTTRVVSLRQSGILSINDARTELGYERVEGNKDADDPTFVASPAAPDPLALFGGPVGGGPERVVDTREDADEPEAKPEAAREEPVQKIEETALNGAQIAQLVDLAAKVTLGELTTDAARSIATAAFPGIPAEKIDAIFRSLVEGSGLASDEEKAARAKRAAFAHDVRAIADKTLPDRYKPCGCCTEVADSVKSASDYKAPEKYSHIDFKPPQGARDEAKRGLEWRREHGRGGTEVGVARARDIANGENLSPETIGRMVSYFARHESDKDGEGFRPGEDGYPSAGRIAWALWGGDAGKSWSEKVQGQMDTVDGKAFDVRAIADKALPNRYRPCGCCTKAVDSDDIAAADPLLEEVFDRFGDDAQDAMEDALQDLQDEYVRAFTEGGAADVDELVEQIRSEMLGQLTPAVEVVTDSVRRSLELTDDVFEIVDRDALAFLETHVSRVASDINATTRETIRAATERGIEQGLPVAEVQSEIQRAKLPKYRAERIARTELSEVSHGSKYTAWKAAGVTHTRWKNAPGATLAHQEIASRSPKKIGEPYARAAEVIQGEEITRDVYYPPARPNCRCTIVIEEVDE